jgi:hypothetical protein
MASSTPKSVQLYLFGDQIIPLSSALSAGTKIAYKNKVVKTNELAVYLCAFALFNLMVKGIIKAEIKKTKVLFLIPSRIMCGHTKLL